MRWWIPVLILTCLPGCATTGDEPRLAGQYRLTEGPDVAGGLELTPDSRFSYFLIAGALEERAEGRWEVREGSACLFTEPRPTPPEFARATDQQTEAGARTILVTWPNGEGIAGIDFRLGLNDGQAIEDYTQYDGWTLPEEEKRLPVWVELSEPMHRLKSPRFELPEGDRGPWVFVLKPNDLGIADFQGACLQREGNAYAFERNGGALRFIKSSE